MLPYIDDAAVPKLHRRRGRDDGRFKRAMSMPLLVRPSEPRSFVLRWPEVRPELTEGCRSGALPRSFFDRVGTAVTDSAGTFVSAELAFAFS